jgi:hypothetical protein
MATALTQEEITAFAKDWYHKLDVHDPLEDFVPLLAEDGVKMVFPEATIEGFEGFKGWYERVINIFFDEVHNVKEATATINGDHADVKVVVGWEASVWKPPAPNSERIVLDAYQTWKVKRSATTGKVVITTYIVDELKYAEGSATL